MKRYPLAVLSAVLCVGAPAVLALWLTDGCSHDDGHHEYVRATLEEMQSIADGEIARAHRMQRAIRQINTRRSYQIAMNAERMR